VASTLHGEEYLSENIPRDPTRANIARMTAFPTTLARSAGNEDPEKRSRDQQAYKQAHTTASMRRDRSPDALGQQFVSTSSLTRPVSRPGACAACPRKRGGDRRCGRACFNAKDGSDRGQQEHRRDGELDDAGESVTWVSIIPHPAQPETLFEAVKHGFPCRVRVRHFIVSGMRKTRQSRDRMAETAARRRITAP